MPENDSNKQPDRGGAPAAVANKSDRRSSPFARWRSLREPRSSRAAELDSSSRAKDAAAVPQLRSEGDKPAGGGRTPVRAIGAVAPAVGASAAASSPAPSQQQQQQQQQPFSSSRSLLSSRQSDVTSATDDAAAASALRTDSSSSGTAEPALAPRGSYARRSLKTLFARPSASSKHKSAAALLLPTQQEQHIFLEANGETTSAKVNDSEAAAAAGSSGSVAAKASRLPSIRKSSGKPIKASRESLPPPATSPQPPPPSTSLAIASATAAIASATAAVDGGRAVALRGSSSKGQGPRDAARGFGGIAGSARPASLNESHLRAAASSSSGFEPSRPSLSMSPVCVDVADGHDWHSGVSLSSPSSSESSIAEKSQAAEQPPAAARAKGSSAAKEQAGTVAVVAAAAPAAAAAAVPRQQDNISGVPPRQSQPLTSVADSTETNVPETKPFMIGHKSEELPAVAPVDGGAAERATVAVASVADAGSVLKFLAEHSKVLSSISPVTKTTGGTAEADIVLQLTDEVKLLKSGLMHCETVLREEEATRHRLERELVEKDAQIKTLHVLLSTCKCRGDREQALQNGWADERHHDGGSPKDLT